MKGIPQRTERRIGKLGTDEAGISNLVVTLILIAVAVVGGAMAFVAMRNQATTATTNASLEVQSLDAVRVDGNAYVSITVKNTGTLRLIEIEATVDPDVAGVSLSVDDLDPGDTGSADNSSPALNAGETYVVQITADTPTQDNVISRVMSVRVRS